MSIAELRVAGVGVSPPAYKASGGISAGVQLMQRVAERCPTHMFLMAERDAHERIGTLDLTLSRPRNVLKPFERILPRALVTLQWRPDFRPWLKRLRPTIVHLHNPHPPGALLSVARACRELLIPYVITTHGFVEFDDVVNGFGAPAWQRPLLNRFVRRPVCEVAAGAARVLMLSPFEEPILLRMGAEKRRLKVVSNGVDAFFLQRLPEAERRSLVHRFALPVDRPLLLFVGNHTPNKGLDVLLGAVRRMSVPATAIVAGAIRSPHENARLVSAAEFTAGDPRLIFTDFITKEELRALYQSAHVFVFPSRADTLPLVILEAMASRLPVVASAVGGIPYEVTAQTGVLVRPGDQDELARELDRVCNSIDLRSAMGDAGHARVQQLFDWDASADQCVNIYRDVLLETADRH